MNKPYIICHMTTSIDGKVTGDFLTTKESEKAAQVYYEINRNYHADAFACGRVTMESSFTQGYKPDLSEYENMMISRDDYIDKKDYHYFAVSFDRRGRVGWTTPCIRDEDPGYNNAHIIEVLCEDVSDAYLAYLQIVGVSYIFAGKKELDISLALKKLKELFGIERLLLEGGSIINGAFIKNTIIDELSLVVAPVTSSTLDKPLFHESMIYTYELKDVKQYPDSIVWLNYKKKKRGEE